MGQSFNLQSKCFGERPLLKGSSTFESASSRNTRTKESFFLKPSSCSFVDLEYGVTCQDIFALKPSRYYNTVFSPMPQTICFKFRLVCLAISLVEENANCFHYHFPCQFPFSTVCLELCALCSYVTMSSISRCFKLAHQSLCMALCW